MRAAPPSDRIPVRRRNEVTCPVCNADIPLGGDEKGGDEIYCTYCGAPCKLKAPDDDGGDMDAEEDF